MVPIVLAALGMGVLLFNPVTLILGAYHIGVPASQLVPSCRTRTFTSGGHRGFSIGMGQAEAAAVVARENGYPIQVRGMDDWPRSAQEATARSPPEAVWWIGLGNTCVVQNRRIELQFSAGRLVKITDNVDVNWL
ncbi:hypothetical protein WDZ92_30375 [Nostoc sp. NIES-2111]